MGGTRGWAQEAPTSLASQPGEVGVDLWLAASGDQRVSIWISDWLQDRCELHDWLSFPAPVIPEVRLSPRLRVGWILFPSHSCPPSTGRPPSTFAGRLLPLEPSTAGVCGPGLGPPAALLQPSEEAGMRASVGAGLGWAGWSQPQAHALTCPSAGGADCATALLCHLPEPVPRPLRPGHRLCW